jgi:hypothetical protein
MQHWIQRKNKEAYEPWQQKQIRYGVALKKGRYAVPAQNIPPPKNSI